MYASGRHALGICDECGRSVAFRTLKETFVKGRSTGLKVCDECWDPDHPQLRVGELRVVDYEALEDARPDSGELAAVRANIVPVTGVVAFGKVGQVVVTTPIVVPPPESIGASWAPDTWDINSWVSGAWAE